MTVIAIPLKDDNGMDSHINEHFSRSPYFMIIGEKGDTDMIIENKAAFAPGHEGTLDLLKDHDVDMIICSGIGPGALEYADELGMKVCFGRAKSAKELLDMHAKGDLEDVVNGSPCR
ncbi:MAG TPA: NifB/NifX family molybdenum-iron cluster-binding protein [Candidatus Methanofastidiosa archaeon]|nr:NifB/NifX family molybdenum-iron cluster-binding protein [Candidatus Methanofastidiosa archaeon]HPR41938.1 NifB/NifX family molybdenum-iron cluster-binding protein [Candidatus Methanofastidiosa archaeon]